MFDYFFNKMFFLYSRVSLYVVFKMLIIFMNVLLDGLDGNYRIYCDSKYDLYFFMIFDV